MWPVDGSLLSDRSLVGSAPSMASLETVLSGEAVRSLRTSSSYMPPFNSTSLISSAKDKNEAERPLSSSGLGGMGLMVLFCSCGKGRGVGETPAADISRSS